VDFNYFDSTAYEIAKGTHNLDSDTLMIGLSNASPSPTNTVWADITEISAGNGYSAGGTAISSLAVSQVSDTGKLDGDNVTFTASGGSIAQFQYLVLYNDTAASKQLLGYWDAGAAVDLYDGDEFTINLSGGILTVSHP
jgi:hypothetical protein